MEITRNILVEKPEGEIKLWRSGHKTRVGEVNIYLKEEGFVFMDRIKLAF